VTPCRAPDAAVPAAAAVPVVAAVQAAGAAATRDGRGVPAASPAAARELGQGILPGRARLAPGVRGEVRVAAREAGDVAAPALRATAAVLRLPVLFGRRAPPHRGRRVVRRVVRAHRAVLLTIPLLVGK
jgi:hypothetical protein